MVLSDGRPPPRSPKLPLVEVLIGDARYPATPVLLQGHRASVVMEKMPASQRRPVRLRLEWVDGSATTLEARVRTVHSNGQVAHFDVEGIGGAWEPFVAYLGGNLHGSANP